MRAEGGAVVKTIGDAIMATFPTPERGLGAALGMRDAMVAFNRSTERDDDRLDYVTARSSRASPAR